MINHLRTLFVPRIEQDSVFIARQTKELHFVLRCVQSLAIQSRADMKDLIWPDILKFLLFVSDRLLTPAYQPGIFSF